MTNDRIETRPISGALGAEIHGVDLAEDMDAATFGEIRQALHDHLVIFFRDQTITPEQQLDFARRFGDIETHAYAKGLPGRPEILPVIKEAEDRAANFSSRRPGT